MKVKRVYYVTDCQRLQRIALAHGFELSLLQCQDVWNQYSESWSASWLILRRDSDDEIWEYMAGFIEEDLS